VVHLRPILGSARIQPRRRSQRRFWSPGDGLYYQYRRPETIIAVCTRCGSRFPFKPDSLGKPKQVSPGVYEVLRGEIEGAISGRGGCGNCGQIIRCVDWPNDASFKVSVPEGRVALADDVEVALENFRATYSEAAQPR
jgi:hypothetical protein